MTNDSTEHLAQTSDAPTEPGLTRRAALAGAAGLAGASLIGAGDTEAQTDDATAVAEEPSLYERLGGIFAIAAVVDRFSDAIITNPKLNENPALKAWNETEAETRLPGLKFMRTLWVASLAGGPMMLRKGWPHVPAKIAIRWPHEAANRQRRKDLENGSARGEPSEGPTHGFVPSEGTSCIEPRPDWPRTTRGQPCATVSGTRTLS